jgi:hypothetical protein
VDLVTPLKAYIDAKYAGGYAADAAEDLSVIQALRAEVVANALVSPDARRDLLVRCAHPASPSTGMQLCHTGWSRCSGDTHVVWLPSPVGGHLRPLARYYRTLLLLEARFPIGKAKDAVNKLSFTWCVHRSAAPSPTLFFLSLGPLP